MSIVGKTCENFDIDQNLEQQGRTLDTNVHKSERKTGLSIR